MNPLQAVDYGMLNLVEAAKDLHPEWGWKGCSLVPLTAEMWKKGGVKTAGTVEPT